MAKDLSNYRKTYDKGELNENDLPENPITLFSNFFNIIENNKFERESNAMSLSTVDINGFPSTRVVLLKKYSELGFVFFTNYNSQKGKDILNNPNVCLSFYWPSVEQQIIIKGIASKISKAESNDYFNSRPEGSKLGAIVSNQSEVISSRELLYNKLDNLKNSNEELKRPENWGGFIVKPFLIEFWQGKNNRLHDRIVYKNNNDKGWKFYRLSP
ncbi:MAG: pyridoxamine 5'-phosphate oxidase [Flavobacteriales bacterium]|jgi:pyridoxamine 5'-phosphate oxidase|tara:strand:+ start:2720 stop:3361 length:642 start_codon:yes stop_codon:yes gene_type:complete